MDKRTMWRLKSVSYVLLLLHILQLLHAITGHAIFVHYAYGPCTRREPVRTVE